MAKRLMIGNEAIAEAAILAGCEFYFGYPITPQNEITAYMARRMPELGRTFIQAESELAAISMVYGASAAGGRAMTTSSSPGISLKQEGISYLAGAELPGVIVNIARGGPGLGNIAPSQADYFQATRGGGHGDYRTITFGPASVQELADYTIKAFDLADKYRIGVVILADGVLGQMLETVEFRRSKEEEFDKSWCLSGCQGRRPNVIKSLYLCPEDLEEVNKRLEQKYEDVKKNEVVCECYLLDDAKFAIVAFGICARIAKEAVNLARDIGIKIGLIRPITLWPFPDRLIFETADFIERYLVVEMNMGQMIEDVRLAVNGRREVKFYGRYGGVVPTPGEVFDAVKGVVKEKEKD
jgi:2-oxoglutarate ferredoxin oxidoreductase subunit alpha